jgi:hypothetical protein
MRDSRLHCQPLIMPEAPAALKHSRGLSNTALAEPCHTDGYGAVLHLVVLMELDPEIPEPQSDEERANWQGHLEGLRAALLCLAMHERALDPESAAMFVDEQLEQARAELQRLRPEEAGG